MFITLSVDKENSITKPLFYSLSVLQARNDLKKYALKILKQCESKHNSVLTFKYSLDDFENCIVARFADDKSHSIEIIQFAQKETGYLLSNIIREIKVVNLFYFMPICPFNDIANTNILNNDEEASKLKKFTCPSVPQIEGYEQLMQELRVVTANRCLIVEEE